MMRMSWGVRMDTAFFATAVSSEKSGLASSLPKMASYSIVSFIHDGNAAAVREQRHTVGDTPAGLIRHAKIHREKERERQR